MGATPNQTERQRCSCPNPYCSESVESFPCDNCGYIPGAVCGPGGVFFNGP